MNSLKNIRLVKLEREQLDMVVDWAANEGWNPGLNDAEVFWNTDPDGFYGVLKDDELIASGSVVSYNGEYGFMGFFIVKPEYRGSGLGRELWNKRKEILLSRLRKDATIGMDGVVDMQEFYAKGGFKLAYKDMRMEGMGREYELSEDISLIEENDFIEVSKYDRECFGFDRSTFLSGWLKQSNAKAFKYKNGNNAAGIAVIRKAMNGYKIGPLFGDNLYIAEKLFEACSDTAKGEKLFLDIPKINKESVALAKKYGLKPCFECGRMYYGKPIDVPLEKTFGVTTFELG
ncbi:MAG: GNAT family N-acetyltransferase [Bacteroidetes bacterium]|nr:GNAT family N-acetyltransferase [Bacteroidota bacterium]